MRLRIPKHDHVPSLPVIHRVLGVIQLLLASIVLALAATTIARTPWSHGIPNFALFVSLVTIVVLTYRAMAVLRYPALYNRIAVLVLECFLVVWWLSAFAGLAAWSAAVRWLDEPVCTVDRSGERLCITKRADFGGKKYRGIVAAAASLGAVEL
jgi:hypothetical protein